MPEQTPGTAIVPFGKYKGKPVEAMRADRSYVDWLMGQDWFRQRYSGLFQIIVNNFGEPSETPEHNRIQTRFLDDAFCRGFFSIYKTFHDPRLAISEKAEQHRRWLQSPTLKSYDRADSERELAKLEQFLADYDARPPSRPYPIAIVNRAFEAQGWDVVLEANLRFDDWGINESLRAYVEIKPSLGDDFPAVLRQMKANRAEVYETPHAYVLVIDEFTATGATLSQVNQMFMTAGFAVFRLARIEAELAKLLDERAEAPLSRI